jgi:hypothetical protein
MLLAPAEGHLHTVKMSFPVWLFLSVKDNRCIPDNENVRENGGSVRTFGPCVENSRVRSTRMQSASGWSRMPYEGPYGGGQECVPPARRGQYIRARRATLASLLILYTVSPIPH